MNRKTGIIITILLSISLGVMGQSLRDSSNVLTRLFDYQAMMRSRADSINTYIYLRQTFQTERRNPTLWLIPSMYPLAKGERSHLSEQYLHLVRHADGERDLWRLLYYTTIRRQRRPMDVLYDYMLNSIYSPTLYAGAIMSPFCREFKRYYRYSAIDFGHDRTMLVFKPKYHNNTQLIKGKAIVRNSDGRIVRAEFEGEHDMIDFKTSVVQSYGNVDSILPSKCNTDVTFRFAGNRVKSEIRATYGCAYELPDSISIKGDREALESVRPDELSEEEEKIYARLDSINNQESTQPEDSTTSPLRRDYIKEIGWDLIGEKLVSSWEAESKKGYVSLSPIIYPHHFSYSGSKGLAYKLTLDASYRFNDKLSIYSDPMLGYNFKKHLLYYNIPVRFNYNPRHESYIELEWGNGNHISNSSVLEEIEERMGKEAYDSLKVGDKDLDMFKDYYLQFNHHTRLSSKLAFDVGTMFHERKAINPTAMRDYGKEAYYRSFAPYLKIMYKPLDCGPMFTLDYQRAIQSHKYNYIGYERWEGDISYKKTLPGCRAFNVRAGGGLYTDRHDNYFLDFSNFHEDNLPGGWDDPWTGDFQLLDSRLYNMSRFYLRTNLSYEVPLMIAAHVPLIGRFVERERFYWSGLVIEHEHPYSEIGYGFTTRFVSVGVFVSMTDVKIMDFGAKFSFELFRKW